LFSPPLIDVLSIFTAISVPNLRNGYAMKRQESNEKAREAEKGIMRRQKKGKKMDKAGD
jgi:hypothetical protein